MEIEVVRDGKREVLAILGFSGFALVVSGRDGERLLFRHQAISIRRWDRVWAHLTGGARVEWIEEDASANSPGDS